MQNLNYSLEQKNFIERYNSPVGYFSWETMAKRHVKYIITNHGHHKSSPRFFERLYKAPAYFLTDDLFESLFRTDIKPKTFLQHKPHLVAHDFFLFQSLDFNRVCYTYVNMDTMDTKKNHDVSGFFHLRFPGFQEDYSFAFNWDELPQVDVDQIGNSKDSCCKKCTNRIYNMQLNLVANFILLLNTQPEIVSEEKIGRPTRGKGFKVNSPNEIRSVNWVGKTFNRKISKKTIPSEVAGSSSPKTSHWRRGHWHTVLQGPGRQQKRMKWFQPTFIVGNA
tara:strand:+ start:56 stop:889 length:834 start_codon:yes stop_codon:yes gene_type:complete